MPKGAWSPRGMQDADRRLSPTSRATTQSTSDQAPASDGVPSIVRRAQTNPGTVSPSEIVALQRAIGMRAVGSLIAPTVNRADIAGGKGADGFAIRRPAEDDDQEQAPSGGKVQRDVISSGRGANSHPNFQAGTLQRDDDDETTTAVPTTGGSGSAAPAPAPPGLTKKTVQGPDAHDRGGYNWVVQWELDKPSPKGGWIVQGVNVAGKIQDKDGKAIPTGWDAYVPYWEAWQVHAGQKVTTYAEGGDVLDDTFSNPSYAAGSKGEVSETGTPQFYEGLTLPSSFKANGVAPAGILPATKSDPGLSGGSGVISHSIKATWDSSKGSNATTVSTT
ncbi:MAG TPA: hypothetical protein VFZ25_18590 [Chloroflexota bacterium]|nr:hypothetical protein [Chloroflexota bacterium]